MEKKTALSPLKHHRFKVFLGPTLKLFECVMELMSPFVVRYIIDEGIAKGDIPLTIRLSLLLFLLAILGFVFTMLAQYLAARVSADYSYALRKDLYANLSALSESDLQRFGKQKILTLIVNDSFYMQNGVMMFMRLIFRPPFLLLGATILSFLIDYRAGLIFLGAVTLSSFIIGLVILVSPKRYAAIQNNLDEISTLTSDALNGARPIKAFDKIAFEEKKYEKSLASYKKRNMSMAKFNSLVNPFTFLFVNLSIVLVIFLAYRFGVIDASHPVGFVTIGQLVSLISYLVSSLAALVMFSRLIVSLNKAKASKKRIDEFLAYSPTITNKKTYSKKDEVGDDIIIFEDVSLTYGEKGDKPAVSNLSFRIKKGSWIGLIGGTGSGKSTTVSLLERLYEPSYGQILYRGRDLKEYDLLSLRKEIALVSQKPSLFKGTIRNNLLMSNSQASESEMIEALKQSLAYEFVAHYDDFLDHEVEEGGNNFSGGQKQRLLIASALLKKSDVLILDDATSALDYLSDRKVRANISEIEGLTKIIISQRASSLKDCDLILLYDGGRIVAQGNHEELLEKSPLYREIYEMQRKGA